MLLGLILVNPTVLDEIFAEGQICENLIFHFPVQRNIVHLSLAGVYSRPLFFIMAMSMTLLLCARVPQLVFGVFFNCFFLVIFFNLFQPHHILLSFINLFTVVSCGKKFGLKNMPGMKLKHAFCKQISALKNSTLSSPAAG